MISQCSCELRDACGWPAARFLCAKASPAQDGAPACRADAELCSCLLLPQHSLLTLAPLTPFPSQTLQAVAGEDHSISVISVASAEVVVLLQGEAS